MAVKKTFPDRKPNFITKAYLSLCGFVVFGFVIFLILIILNKLGLILPPNSPWFPLIFNFLKVWGIILAFSLPLGLVSVGLWGIIYKESAFRVPTKNVYIPPVALKGKPAVLLGVFYLLLGLILVWAVTGVVLSFCSSSECLQLPKFIKFF